jgi:Escherichia/Staphylococcus phage prohead protease
VSASDEWDRLERERLQAAFEWTWAHNQRVPEMNARFEALGIRGRSRPIPLPTPKEIRRRPPRRKDAGAGGLTPAPAGSLVLVRSFPASVQAGSGRTIAARLIRYGVASTVADPPDYRPYKEAFQRGAFYVDGSADRTLLNYEHRHGIADVIGRALSLNDRPDGLHAEFKLLSTAAGDAALELAREGVLTGISIEFKPLESKVIDGIVQRTKVRLGDAALTRRPAHAGAEVLAVREALANPHD